MFYNFVRIHQTLKVTPAMAAGVTAKLWEVADVVAVIEAWEAEHAVSGIIYQVAKDRIGEGFHVRVLARYEAPRTQHFPTIEAANTFVESEKASHRPGRRRKAAN